MPSKSKKQHNFMEAIAHSEKFAKKVGVPMSVGKDFVEADKGKKFRMGGMSSSKAGINKQKTHHGAMQMPNAMLNKYIGHKEGGLMKHDDMAQDKPMMKKIADVEAKKVVKGHEKRMHKMASGGKVGQLSKADGCATKGKSKGTMIKMSMGGKC
jgi:hypothetical protein